MSQPQPAKVVSINRGSDDILAPEAESESRSVFDPPKMPKFLKGAAKKHWNELVESLGNRHKIINDLDADVLAVYCQTYARWLDADAALDEFGMYQVTPNGYRQSSPEFTTWQSLSNMIFKQASKLGLTPPARFQLKTSPSDKQNLLDF
jgi:P27 family predicted phage terminase small subunit